MPFSDSPSVSHCSSVFFSAATRNRYCGVETARKEHESKGALLVRVYRQQNVCDGKPSKYRKLRSKF